MLRAMQAGLIRAVVLDVVARVRERGELADRALDRALRAHRELHSRERRRVSEAVFALVRMARRIDFLLEHVDTSWSNRSTPDRDRLRFAAALVTEVEAELGEALSLAGLESRDRRVLERLLAADVSWPADPIERLAVERSVPEWLARKLVDEFGADADLLLAELNRRAPLTLRTNLLKTSREALLERLAAEHVEARPGAFSPWAVVLGGRPNVFGLDAFKEGLFEVQDEGSQLIALASGARPGKRVIDVGAGGGGKTLALAAMMQNKGALVPVDVTEARMRDLKPRAKRAGVFNLQPMIVPADAPDSLLEPQRGRADIVLVDAPCSGTGAWRRNPDARWRLTEAELAEFPSRQVGILHRYAPLVRPGGRMVYASCSVFRSENEEVVDAFLAEHPDFEVKPLEGLDSETLDAKGRLKLLPHVHGTDGFFAAGLVRKK